MVNFLKFKFFFYVRTNSIDLTQRCEKYFNAYSIIDRN